ncbi:MAG: hypothetical protein U0768_05410 [Anaerolineae bacterium]
MSKRVLKVIVVGAWMLIGALAGCQASAPAAQPKPAAPGQASTPVAASALSYPTPQASGPEATARCKLVYVNDAGFFWYEPATGNRRPLAPLRARTFVGAPAVSADGKRIVYSLSDTERAAQKHDNGTDLYVMDADGKNERLLVDHGAVGSWLGEPVWTPDGKSVYFTRRDAHGAETIERVDVASGTTGVILQDAATPTISPDGKHIAYLKTDPQAFTQDLWVANLDGSGARRLLGDPEFTSLVAPRFAPDSQRIVFVAVGGPARPPVERPKASGFNPLAWFSPAVAEAHGVPYNIWTVNVDGSNLTRLTNDLEIDSPVTAWSPDGAWIAFMGDLGMYLVSAKDGTQLRYLGKEFAVGGMDWPNCSPG